ncbi:MAG TPA: hypothetical protein ENG05_03365, partial [Acidilobales archaeon]|nr:hypothetical protein [Acidilobales archaeon]
GAVKRGLRCAVIISLIVILITSIQPLTLIEVGSISEYSTSRFVKLKVPAVYIDEKGVMHGASTEFLVGIAWPGEGTVYFSAEPLTQIDMQAASRVAAIIASIYAGTSLDYYDFFVRVKSRSEIVGGPSASAITATAFLALITNASILPNVSMTGMIEPDGTIGPVGGVAEKLEAMAKEGIKVFLIPKGQSVVKVLRRYVENKTIGRTVIISERIVPVTVNVTELGAKLGVKVVEVGSIIEAYEYLTGRRLSLPKYSYEYPEWLREELVKLTKILVEDVKGNLSLITSDVRKKLSSVIDEVKEHLDKVDEYLKAHKYYSAVSEAFIASVLTSYITSVAKALSSKNLREALNVIKNEVRGYVNGSLSLISKCYELFKKLNELPLTDVRLQLAIAAYVRLREANDTIRNIGEYPIYPLSIGEDALYHAVYALWRAKSALNYLTLALRTEVGVRLNTTLLANGINTLLHFAMSVRSYLESLGGSTYPLSQLEVSRLVEEGRFIEASSAVVEALTRNVALMHAYFKTEEKLAPYAREGARMLAGRAQSLGVTLVLPALYIERADTVTDPLAKIELY